MKYFAAYTLLTLAGKTPTAEAIGKIIEAAGGESDAEVAEKLVAELSAKVCTVCLRTVTN